jgi:hypothetical protein
MQKRKLTVGKFKFDKIFVLIFILISGNIPLANLLFVLNKSYLFLGFTFLLLFNILNQKKRIQKKRVLLFFIHNYCSDCTHRFSRLERN